MEETVWQPELPVQASYVVDAEASLVVVSHCQVLRGRMFELGLEGCRVRMERAGTLRPPVAVEVIFKINGLAFRLAGCLERLEENLTMAVRFSPMAARRRVSLEDLLAELAEKIRTAQAMEEAHEAGGEKKAERAQSSMAGTEVVAMPSRPERPNARPEAGGIPSRTTPAPISIARTLPASPHPGQQHRASAPAGRERRAQSRRAVDTGATIFLIDVRAQVSGRIVDLSPGGCRIRTDERFPVGIYRRVETEFKLDGLPFRLGGVVQSLHDKFTVGIRFLDISPRKKEQLEQLMEEIEEAGTKGTGNRS